MRAMHIGLVLLAATGSALAANGDAGWKEITKGVYQKAETDGSLTTMSFGVEGASYDRAKLQKSADALRAKVATGEAGADDAHALADALVAIDGIPARAESAKSSVSSSVCGYAYKFDSQLEVGTVGATATARGVVYALAFVMPPAPATSTTYASATVTPAYGAAVTRTTNLSPSYMQAASADADWTGWSFSNGYPIDSGSCSASTFAYIRLTGGSCGATTGYVSQTKNYPSCVTSP